MGDVVRDRPVRGVGDADRRIYPTPCPGQLLTVDQQAIDVVERNPERGSCLDRVARDVHPGIRGPLWPQTALQVRPER